MTDLNKAIVKVAQSNPEFRRALVSELKTAARAQVYVYGHHRRLWVVVEIGRTGTLKQVQDAWKAVEQEGQRVEQTLRQHLKTTKLEVFGRSLEVVTGYRSSVVEDLGVVKQFSLTGYRGAEIRDENVFWAAIKESGLKYEKIGR